MFKLFKPLFILSVILAAGLYFSFALAQITENEEEIIETLEKSDEAAQENVESLQESAQKIIEETAEEPTLEITEAINQDIDIQPSDLDISDQKLLPDNPLYFVKNIFRGVQSAVTFDPVKKAELKLKFASEKIIEAKKLAEKTDNPNVLKNGLENYKNELDMIQNQVDKIKESVTENPKVDKFVEKFIDHNLKQQKLMDKLEEKLPEEVFDKMQEVKEEIAKKFTDVSLKIATPEEVKNKIIKITDEQTGSNFKQFKNLEVLKRVEEKAPEQAKLAIRHAQDNAMKRLHEQLETNEHNRELFKDYAKHISGNEVRHLEIITNFEDQMIPLEIRDIMGEAKKEAMKRIQKRIIGFKQEEHKQKFLTHLEDGKIEDLRIIRELENDLPPDIVSGILEIKNKAMGNFQQEITTADTPEKQEALFKKMEEFHDVKQFAMFKEMDALIPEDKKDFWESMKQKAKNEMEMGFAQAETEMDKQMFFKQMAGYEPEDMAIIKEFGPPPEILNEILKEQAARLNKKVLTTEDAEKLRLLKQKIEEEENVKQELETRHPGIFKKIENREEALSEMISPEKVKIQLQKAEHEITLAEKELADADREFLTPAQKMLASAKKSLADAQRAFLNENFGQTFGQATAALHQANSARRIIKEINLRVEIKEKMRLRKENMMERENGAMQEMKKDMMRQESFEEKQRFLPPSEQKSETYKITPSSKTERPIAAPSNVINTTPWNCTCVAQYDPICGKDNQTYSNECTAKCNRVEIAYKGFCKSNIHNEIKTETKIEPLIEEKESFFEGLEKIYSPVPAQEKTLNENLLEMKEPTR